MNTHKAIELAKSAGYEYLEGNFTLATDSIFLDPLFWQSLGKALRIGTLEQCHEYDTKYKFCVKCAWHRFIDTLAEGKTAEDFFTDLLTNQ